MTTCEERNEPSNAEAPLPIPTSFPAFPFATPYDIQVQFMQQLFECIDRRKVGIFESPTGTGKSLSMICGALSWLFEHENNERKILEQDSSKKTDASSSTTTSACSESKGSSSTPAWVLQHQAVSSAHTERQEREKKAQELNERVQVVRMREKRIREEMSRKKKRTAAGMSSMRSSGQVRQQATKKSKDSQEDLADDIGAFLVDEYDSDEERKSGSRGTRHGFDNGYSNVSNDVLDLLKRFEAKEDAHRKATRSIFGQEDDLQEPDVLKFVEELRKTAYGEHLHIIALGSRKNLCINEKIRKKASDRPRTHGAKSTNAIKASVNVNKLNDACLEAQKAGTPSDQRCPFLPIPSSSVTSIDSLPQLFQGKELSTDSEPFAMTGISRRYGDSTALTGDEKLLEFRDHALAHVRDIEELAALGTELETCPYYGGRHTVRHCQLVTLPYNLLLHKSTRESLKLVIKDNILLLDEAHNLTNSLLQMHSVVLSLDQIILAQDQLQVYLNRFELRLSSTNEGYIRVLIRILKALQDFVTRWMSCPSIDDVKSLQERHGPPIPAIVPPHEKKDKPFQPRDRVMKVNEFLHDAKMDHINLFKAHAYLEKSGVARKLQGFHENLQKREERKRQQEQERKFRDSDLGQVKIHSDRVRPSVVQPSRVSQATSSPVLLTVDAFLMSLLNPDNDGRVVVAMEESTVESLDHNGGDDNDDNDDKYYNNRALGHDSSQSLLPLPKSKKPVLKFMLLNPARVFQPLVEEARSVVLAGGTMEPVSDLLSHLFPYLKGDSPVPYPRVHRFSCGHVIPKENLLTLVIERSPTGLPLSLGFSERSKDEVMDAIGLALVNMLNLIPDGVVVFFVSYSYMAQALARWRQKVPAKGSSSTSNTAMPVSIMDRIQRRKRVFLEPRESSEADRMLREYHDCIHANSQPQPNSKAQAGSDARPPQRPDGAVLFSVVGGKMSEGINFSDRLGRGVIMIGMPFPNKASAELQERMRYMDEVQAQEQLSFHAKLDMPAGVRITAGSEYYENLCMRAVNQSIGRAIRHQNDHAVIVLLDKRYGTPRIRKKLPGWIGESIEVCEQFGPVIKKLATFFRSKQEGIRRRP
ncbi:ATP-dependent DNA helicase chl1 [Podila epigama]|nr:ATP-dependent DNA helicase chl1 [Podila epigama]